MIESIVPSPLTKTHLSRGLQAQHGLMQHTTALTLTRCLKKLGIVQDVLRDIAKQVETDPHASTWTNPWFECVRDLEYEVRRRIPDILVIIAFAQKSATLAPDDEADEDASSPLKTKSAVLTESALRLFRLYHTTMPSIAAEMKFDIGRLLVSSSSVKTERKERKLAKSQSVAGTEESLMSVGTVGTAGMGGGFGYARGEVRGWDALSQSHVLNLLRDVGGWDWTKKSRELVHAILGIAYRSRLSVHLCLPYSATSRLHTLLIHHLEHFRPTTRSPRADNVVRT